MSVRILLVTHYFSTHRSGVEQVAAQLAGRLAQTGTFRMEWFASDCDVPPDLGEHVRMYPMRAWNGLEKAGLPWPVWTWRSLSTLRTAVAGADVVHIHDFIYCGNIAAFIFARWQGKPVVITQHTGDVPYRNWLLTGTLKLLNRTLGRFMLSRARQVVFISDDVRRQFTAHTRFTNAPLFLPNGVDTTIFYCLPPDGRAALRNTLATPGRPVFLFAGRFVASKGLALLHQLAQSMPEADWWFAGWGPYSDVHPAIWNIPNVRVFEDRTGASLADLYRAADLLLLPSRAEGFPLVVQEAMACGTSALVSPEAAVGAPAALAWLFTCPLAPVASGCQRWKTALLDIIRSGNLDSRREAVAAFARREWSWDNCVATYAALFQMR